MVVTIRRASFEDYEACTRLVMEVHALHARNAPWLFKMPADGKLWSAEEFSEMVEGPESAVLLAEAGREAVGFAHIELNRSPALEVFTPRLSCSVDSIGVNEAWQHRGVGKQLMSAVERWAEEQGADEISLSVHSFNQGAIQFYHRLGFVDYLLRMRLPLSRKGPPAG
jgi:ribosomal protein S18 acetylase RimI-like enzyme